jgi:Fic family protein
MKRAKIKEFLRESNAVEGVYSEEAFKYALMAFTYLKKYNTLTLENVLQCHKILMRKLNKAIAGKLRTVNVYVGGDAKIDHKKVESELTKWFRNASPIANPSRFKDFKDIKRSHVDFENIHPFEDGNGRVGRIIMLWHGVKTGVWIPIIYEDTKHHYYKWFVDEEAERKKKSAECLALFNVLTKEKIKK